MCPNCAAVVEGGGAPPPRSKSGSAISVMPLAKSSGQRKGFLDMDGASLEVNTRQRVVEEGVGHNEPEVVHNSGLGTEQRENRRTAQQLAPEAAAPEAIAARQAAEAAGDSGWMKPVLVVLIVVGVAVGGKFLMDYLKKDGKKPAAEPASELTLDDY